MFGQPQQQGYNPHSVQMQAIPVPTVQPQFVGHYGMPQGGRALSNTETKESIDSWYNSTKAMIRAIPVYQRYMDLTWTAHCSDVNRGFTDSTTDANLTKKVQSTQVEALIDLVCVNVPEIDINHIRSEATSLNWIYNYIREHYGVKRTGRQMMQKFGVLQRKEGERLNSFWNRFQGFYAENRIRKDDEIKISNSEGRLITATADEKGERYRLSSDIVTCLYLAHPELPKEVEKMLSSKLENQDVASLQREIFVKANIALEQLDQKTTVRRSQPFLAATRPKSLPSRPHQERNANTKRKPRKPEHYCSACLRSQNNKDAASSHFIKDCPYLSTSDKSYILGLYDKALRNRLVSPSERDHDISVRFIDLVESYYGLEPEVQQINNFTPDDLLADNGGPSAEVCAALQDLDVSVVRVSHRFDPVSLRRVCVTPSPTFTTEIVVHDGSGRCVSEKCVVDTGCTGEVIINEDFAKKIKANISHSVIRSAKLADGTASMSIIGETKICGSFKGNDLELNALVSKIGDPLLLGMPGAEKLGLIINCDNKTITWRNGESIRYRSLGVDCQHCNENGKVNLQSVQIRRFLLQSPKLQSVLLPGDEIELKCIEKIPEGRYGVEPNINARRISQPTEWLQPQVIEIKDQKVVTKNLSNHLQLIARKDNVAQIHQMTAIEKIPSLSEEEITIRPKAKEESWRDIILDPDQILPPQMSKSFYEVNKEYACVFNSDLPKYNGKFGRVEAVINVPESLPTSSRLKEVPWYPRTKLIEMQEKIDELEKKGALARPQDINVEVVAVNPSFLVAKKPASRGYRLVTAFGHLACHVKNPPAPMQSTDGVLRRLSTWKYLITSDIAQAYHQIPLARSSQKFAAIASPFKGLRVYQTAAMGMPGSEIALNELTSLLFGQLRQEGILEILMDDIYIGGDSPSELLENWKKVLQICKEADIRLGPSKVVIAPSSVKILGWLWKKGLLEIDPHASNRLQSCKPPQTAEGLRGWIGAFRYMAPAIQNHGPALEPLHKAIGEKSKKETIQWTEELIKVFEDAQKILKTAKPLTMPKPGEQLYITSDASQTGIGATLHRARDKAVIKHFSKQLSADKKRWNPCELEALAVGTSLHVFLPFIRESGCQPIVYTDSTPVVMAYKLMQRGEFSASPRVATFLHEVLNQGADVRYLKGSTNVTADQASRNSANCDSSKCQVCKWINEKEDQVVRACDPIEIKAILTGETPTPYTSKSYWRKRQIEDQVLRQVAFYLKHGSQPPKTKTSQYIRQYLQKQHKIYLSDDNVLLAPSVTEFSTTPRFVVPQAAALSIIAVFHQQFDCLPQTPLKNLLRRHFFIFKLEELTQKFVQSCYRCAPNQRKEKVIMPMSSVPPPTNFGEQFATDIVSRFCQKILVLRETATSFTWAKLVANEQKTTLEEGLRNLFSQVRPPMAIRPSVCRVDNAAAFKSLADNDCLKDLGIRLDKALAKNKNSNPVAEKANQELHECITAVSSGQKITSDQLATAVSRLNSKPRWSKLSAIELWTGRDMITGESLTFDQGDIIKSQQERRLRSHPEVEDQTPRFKENDIVFCNSEKNKLKTRDQLVVREELDNGMYRLDRIHKNSGRVTKAFIPGRDLYKPTTFDEDLIAESIEESQNFSHPIPHTSEDMDHIVSQTDNCNSCKQPDNFTPKIVYQEDKEQIAKNLVPPAQGYAQTYKLPYPVIATPILYAYQEMFNSEQVLTAPSLVANAIQNEVIANIDNESQHSGSNNEEEESNSYYDSAEENHLEHLSSDDALMQDESNVPLPPPEPERRYPVRKRTVPSTFQYEEIVNKRFK